MFERVHWDEGGCIEKGVGALGMGRVRRIALDRRKVRIFRGGGSYIGVGKSSLEGTELNKCIGGDGGR